MVQKSGFRTGKKDTACAGIGRTTRTTTMKRQISLLTLTTTNQKLTTPRLKREWLQQRQVTKSVLWIGTAWRLLPTRRTRLRS